MKPMPKIASFILLIALAIAIGWWMSSSRIQPEPIAATPMPVPSTKRSSRPQSLPKPDDLPKIVQPYARTPMLNLADPRWKEYEAKRKLDPTSEWRTPIEFYGKVIDETGQPVAGAEIEYSWSGTVEKYGRDGVAHRALTSDSNGLFHIYGIEGKGMSVHVRKEGCYRKKLWNNNSFEYAGFWEPNYIEPDRNAPVVFHLVRRPVAEPTYHVDFRSISKPPVWETQIDFLGQPAETASGGDIALKIVRPSNPGFQNPFDWQLKIEGQRGAEIIMSDDEFMLRAPDEGYQKSIAMNYKQARGSSVQTVKFYVRNKARKFYAAVSVEVTPYYPDHITQEDTACFIVTGTVNPNDSQNLEYDPAMDIRKRE